MQSSRWLWLPVVLYMAAIFVLSSLSNTPPMAGHADKWLHGMMYAGLTAFIVRALSGGWRIPVSLRIALAAVVLAAAYGVSDEIHQRFVPLRQADVMDVAADAMGAAVAAFGLYGWDIIRGRHAL